MEFSHPLLDLGVFRFSFTFYGMGRIGPERHSFLSFSGRVWYGVDLYFFFFSKLFKFFFSGRGRRKAGVRKYRSMEA